MNPKCPDCGVETKRIADNEQFESWGCEPCRYYLNRGKPKPEPKPDLVPVGEIKLPEPIVG